VIPQLVPAGVVVEEAGEADWSAALLPEEEPLVARAVEKRRREFAAGRACARRALERLGWTGFPVLAGPRREPLWPPGVVGAITHCQGYCAAAVARRAEVPGLGIDAELRGRLPDGVAAMVCTEAERGWSARLAGDQWPTLIFSAKESIYKAWYPVARRWLDYQDADLTFNAAGDHGGGFRARIVIDVEPAIFPWNPLDGRYATTAERVFTAVTLPAAARPR
jgi:4'-phosphopantetheinyl transferase EntD